MSSLANKYTDTIFRPNNTGEIIKTLNTNNIMLGEANLYDLMDVDFLNDNIEEGLVTVSSCGGLTNYKYSKITPPYRLWNEVTLRTRGLVVDSSYNIVARGFNKFFNLSELPAYGIDVDLIPPHTSRAGDSRLEIPRNILPPGLTNVIIGRGETSPDKHIPSSINIPI